MSRTRTSRARAAALASDAPTQTLPVQVEPLQSAVPTIDELYDQARPAVFRLLSAGNLRGAWEYLLTFEQETVAAYWAHMAERPSGPATGSLAVVNG